MSAAVLEAEADDAPAYDSSLEEAIDAVTDGIAEEIDAAEDELEIALLQRLRDTARDWVAPQVHGNDRHGDGRIAVAEAESVRAAVEELRARLTKGHPLSDCEACHFWSIAHPRELADDTVPF